MKRSSRRAVAAATAAPPSAGPGRLGVTWTLWWFAARPLPLCSALAPPIDRTGHGNDESSTAIDRQRQMCPAFSAESPAASARAGKKSPQTKSNILQVRLLNLCSSSAALYELDPRSGLGAAAACTRPPHSYLLAPQRVFRTCTGVAVGNETASHLEPHLVSPVPFYTLSCPRNTAIMPSAIRHSPFF
jgi:hypothetical protein